MKQRLEVWGGLECTVARIGDDFRDQAFETGHRKRVDDLDRIAALGIRTLRYPILWETIAPDRPDEADFSWHDPRLQRLRELNIRPIAGLCHHGSGPRYTHLLDPDWPALLARHAHAVAVRFPHIDLYTPVNEPLTTARFSGLYGHWYPHARNFKAFVRILINECKATGLAMREIRKIRPDAKLVQTEDLGRTFSTSLLTYQADYENERRWLSFDLLCGRVGRDHPWWSILIKNGIEEAELFWFLDIDSGAAPDLIGINHYLTSDRYLDQRLNRYPKHLHGGNGKHRYADAEAVRVPLPSGELGPKARLREAWERYRRPVAVTEVHHGCSRDEQLRWIAEVWRAARDLRIEGADVRAVTMWSMFGTVDWNSLLKRRDGVYEVGLFDVRGSAPRATALAQAAQSLARTSDFNHPVLDRAGWWKRNSRFYEPPRTSSNACSVVSSPRKLLIVGADGILGTAISRIADHRGLDHVLLPRSKVDATNPRRLRTAVEEHAPWAVIDASDSLPIAPDEGVRNLRSHPNVTAAANMASACAERGIPLVTFSPDRIFSGCLGRAYTENDPVDPTCSYGELAVAVERAILAMHDGALVLRVGEVFGPWDRTNQVWSTLQTLSSGLTLKAETDVVSLAYLPDLAHAALDLLIDGGIGVWHLGHPGETSWLAFALNAARLAGLNADLVEASSGEIALNRALASNRGTLMPPLSSVLERYFRECKVDLAAAAPLVVGAE